METESLGHSLYPGHPPRKKERIHCFAEFIIMLSTLLRIVKSFEGFFTKKLREGTLELTQQEPKMQRNPLPNHKGKRVVVVVIHGNLAEAEAEESEGSFHPSTVKTPQKSPKFRPLFNQLRFGPKARKIATKSLMSIATDSGVECFTAESHTSRAYLETTNAITFINEDMKVNSDHHRLLYLMATINGIQIRRALIDTEASLNLIALSTPEAIGIDGKRILRASVEITGFRGVVESTERYV